MGKYIKSLPRTGKQTRRDRTGTNDRSNEIVRACAKCSRLFRTVMWCTTCETCEPDHWRYKAI